MAEGKVGKQVLRVLRDLAFTVAKVKRLGLSVGLAKQWYLPQGLVK